MVTSNQINRVSRALCAAQKAFKTIKRSGTGYIRDESGEREYHYAELQDVLDATVAALNANRITLSQSAETDQNKVKITTRLTHSSGQYLENVLVLPVPEASNRIHAIGTAITYGRRYDLSALLGVASEYDIDGAIQGEQRRQRPPAPTPNAAPPAKPGRKEPKATPAQAQTPPPAPTPPVVPETQPERDFDVEFRKIATQIMAITGSSKNPIWSQPEIMDIDLDKLADEARESRELEPMDIALLRARIATLSRKTPEWRETVKRIMAAGRDLDALHDMLGEASRA